MTFVSLGSRGIDLVQDSVAHIESLFSLRCGRLSMSNGYMKRER